MEKRSIPLNLQFFADDPEPTKNQDPPADNTAPTIDYDRIQQMLNGTLPRIM